MEKTFITGKEAAKITGFSEAYLKQLARAKRVPAHRPTGGKGRFIFERESLLNWMQKT